MNTKFRAWDEEKQKMFYRVMVGNCDQNDENRNCPVVYYEGSGWKHFEDLKCITQSTRTYDKEGREIFVGDVLQIDFVKAIVRFGKYRYYEEKKVLSGNGFYLECLNVMDPDCISPYEPDVLDKAEIIGNIFENPTLEYHFIGLRPKEVEEKK
jgi:yopX protein